MGPELTGDLLLEKIAELIIEMLTDEEPDELSREEIAYLTQTFFDAKIEEQKLKLKVRRLSGA